MNETSKHIKKLAGKSKYVCLIIPFISIRYYRTKLQESIDFLDKSDEVDFKLNERDNEYVQIEIAMKDEKDYTTDWDVLLKRIEDNRALENENEELKQYVNNLKETILKITIAYHRKYDRTIVDLVDEVHEEDITDLIKELIE